VYWARSTPARCPAWPLWRPCTRKKESPPQPKPLLTNALETSRRVLGPAHATTRLCAVSLAKLRLEQQKYAEAETLLRGSLNAKDNEGPYSWQPFEHRSLLGLSLMEQSKLAEAEPLLLAGYRGLLERKSVLPVAVSVEQAGERVVQLYTRWGKADQAAQWRQEVQARRLGRRARSSTSGSGWKSTGAVGVGQLVRAQPDARPLPGRRGRLSRA